MYWTLVALLPGGPGENGSKPFCGMTRVRIPLLYYGLNLRV
jgi:hypothetical protein